LSTNRIGKLYLMMRPWGSLVKMCHAALSAKPQAIRGLTDCCLLLEAGIANHVWTLEEIVGLLP